MLAGDFARPTLFFPEIVNLKKLRKLVPATGLNLLDRFTSFRDSVSKTLPYKGRWLMPAEVDMDKLTEEIVQERQRRD